jgi:hypothetical protein
MPARRALDLRMMVGRYSSDGGRCCTPLGPLLVLATPASSP